MVGVLPALLVLYIRKNVEESPHGKNAALSQLRNRGTIKGNWGLFFT